MLLTSVTAVAFAAFATIVESARPYGVEFLDGQMRLISNRFGPPGKPASYEYIVLGGGTGGNAIAARLALSGASVAVIEAGSFYEIYNTNNTVVPGYNFNYNLGADTSQVLWNLKTEPQSGYNGRSINYTVGKTFGGSSASNYMAYHRPTVGSFDTWADLVGDDDWRWDNVYPFYQASTNFTPPNYDKIDPSYNISYDLSAFPEDGPVQVSYGNHQAAYFQEINSAFEQLGFNLLEGLNSGELIQDQTGYSQGSATIDSEFATRSSSEASYLQLALRLTDIMLYPSTLAHRILFDANKKAIGVEVQTTEQQNYTFTLNATKEVIVSAGALHSPQLLMLSGIGPQAVLDQFNIPVISALEGVGQRLWDQPWIPLSYKINITTNTQIQLQNPEVSAQVVDEYLSNQSGQLAGLGGAEAFGWERFPAANREQLSNSTLDFLSTFPEDWPEAEYAPLAIGAMPDDVGPNDQYWTLGVCLLSTSARGNTTLASANPSDAPLINPNWLGDEGDAEQAVQGLLRVREIAEATGMIIEEYQPGANYTTNEDILQWIREAGGSLIYHATGGCNMGKEDDELAVVDTHARVYGVEGVRVVDASAFPICPPGHPQSTVYMFAEKIANYILSGE